MKSDELKVLYVCNEFPFPPMHGGLVDMWNRIQALHRLGVHLDVIATVKELPSHSELKTVQDQIRTLWLVKRKSFISALFHWKPMLVVVRKELASIRIDKKYDLVLMQSQFVSEILRNRTIQWRKAIIRVENDEYSFHMQKAKAQKSLIKKVIYFQEAIRIKAHSTASFRDADMLWFISYEELEKFKNNAKSNTRVFSLFMPSAVDITLMSRHTLSGKQVLFVGNLSSDFNKEAIVWYILNVHPILTDLANYRFIIAGSSHGSNCDWLKSIVSRFSNISVLFNTDDLSSIYNSSALFVNPMQSGAGVKLKTIEAGVRGLPIISTPVGAEGSGLIPDDHFILANNAQEFSAGARKLLNDKALATGMVERCQRFLLDNYNQDEVLRATIETLSLK